MSSIGPTYSAEFFNTFLQYLYNFLFGNDGQLTGVTANFSPTSDYITVTINSNGQQTVSTSLGNNVTAGLKFSKNYKSGKLTVDIIFYTTVYPQTISSVQFTILTSQNNSYLFSTVSTTAPNNGYALVFVFSLVFTLNVNMSTVNTQYSQINTDNLLQTIGAFVNIPPLPQGFSVSQPSVTCNNCGVYQFFVTTTGSSITSVGICMAPLGCMGGYTFTLDGVQVGSAFFNAQTCQYVIASLGIVLQYEVT